ncbi:uncharacterized protein LOC129592678 [Paramacrobiotus metropolitanus]|uniref:uncharacterized protein LOC129592678 n=1 Tax=Paramacrobiotus metropolitanus TaxID=2943436 RepID=UPI002445EC7C|nr:uncharacterized protein LOC129592678 [Paramacrobiotus metropolitanus]
MKDNRERSLKMSGREKLEKEVDILEEFWRWKPEGTKDEFLDWKTAVDNFVVTRRIDFSDRQEYAAYWDSLVVELSRQEKGTVESLPPMRNLEIKWMSAYDIEVKVPQGIFTEFLEIGRPMEVSWMILKDGEEYSMWQRDATISALRQLDTEHVVVVHCLSAVNPGHHRVSRELRFRMVYNDVNYWRMNQALYKLEHDPSCVFQQSAGLMSLEKVAFPYVFVDEAAQGMEPECLIAITRACEKLVLIGVPAQLGAVVRFPNLQKSHLTTSLFQRLWKVCPWMILVQQYRMHPAISKMVSQITYEDQLVNDECVLTRTSASVLLNDMFGMFVPPPYIVRHHELLFGSDGLIYTHEGIIPMLFVSLARNDELSGSGTSFVNMAEAHFIARLVANILHEGTVFFIPGLEKPRPEEIGIITFYNGQRPQLEIELKYYPQVNERVKDIEISSVDGFQGREKDIIILSCVRSADSYRGRRTLGFTDDPQRLNVAMSRARKALIVVGSLHVFQYSDMWRQYFRYIPAVQADTMCHLLPLPCSTKPPCKICPDDHGLRIQQAMVNMGQ